MALRFVVAGGGENGAITVACFDVFELVSTTFVALVSTKLRGLFVLSEDGTGADSVALTFPKENDGGTTDGALTGSVSLVDDCVDTAQPRGKKGVVDSVAGFDTAGFLRFNEIVGPSDVLFFPKENDGTLRSEGSVYLLKMEVMEVAGFDGR